MIYNHRDFWLTGHQAKGLDRSILTLTDEIEMDNGQRYPAYASPLYGALGYHGPFRPLTPVQERFLAAQQTGPGLGRRILSNVDKDGTARIVQPCGHYVPVVYLVHADGQTVRTN